MGGGDVFLLYAFYKSTIIWVIFSPLSHVQQIMIILYVVFGHNSNHLDWKVVSSYLSRIMWRVFGVSGSAREHQETR